MSRERERDRLSKALDLLRKDAEEMRRRIETPKGWKRLGQKGDTLVVESGEGEPYAFSSMEFSAPASTESEWIEGLAPEFSEFEGQAPTSPARRRLFEQVYGTVMSFGDLRAWDAASRYNLVKSLVGGVGGYVIDKELRKRDEEKARLVEHFKCLAVERESWRKAEQQKGYTYSAIEANGQAQAFRVAAQMLEESTL